MHSAPDISVIVRARDEARSIGRCLKLINAQDTGESQVEVIVVDSGSRDRTVEIAEGLGARVIPIPSREFSFGGALNLGAAGAHGEVLVALSAHALPRERSWLARAMRALSDPLVACASGDRYLPDGSPLTAAVRVDLAFTRAHPFFGYSNAAGAFRASLWRERPFRDDLPGSEDREWSRHWIERGYVSVVDPSLQVDHDHTHDPIPAIYRRARQEAEGFGAFLDLSPAGPRHLAREWWSDLRYYDSPWRARLSHRRAARMLGAYAGRRRARRR